MMIATLALDLGTATGWALRTADGRVISGVQIFKPGRYEGGGMRYLRFRRWLTETKAAADCIGAVYFEEVRRHAGVDAAHVYGGLLGTLTAWCEHHQIPYSGVPVSTIKRHITGRGNADKAAVIAAVSARGYRPADDNEADALAILDWAKVQEVPEHDLVAHSIGTQADGTQAGERLVSKVSSLVSTKTHLLETISRAAGRPVVDWAAIKQSYSAGARSLREIGARFGVTEGAIRKRARKHGWERNLCAPAAAEGERTGSQECGTQQVRTESVSS